MVCFHSPTPTLGRYQPFLAAVAYLTRPQIQVSGSYLEDGHHAIQTVLASLLHVSEDAG